MASQVAQDGGEILFSDLGARVATKLLDPADMNLWRAIEYQTEAFAGSMLGHGHGRSVVPIEIDLGDLAGRFDIWIGIYSFCQLGWLRLRLSSDRYFAQLGFSPEENSISAPYIYEFYWKQAEINADSLLVEPAYASSENGYPAAIRHPDADPHQPGSVDRYLR